MVNNKVRFVLTDYNFIKSIVVVSKKSKYSHIGLQVYIFEKFASKKSLSKLFKIDHFSILIVNSGSLSVLINNMEVTVCESEILVVPIKTPCKIVIMSDKLQICLLSFTTDFVIENSIRRPHIRYFEFFITKLSSKIFLKNKDVLLLIDLLILLNSKVLRPRSHVFKDEIVLFSFNLLMYELAGIYDRSSWNVSLQHSKREKLVLQFFKILEMNCRKQHSVKYYANSLGINTDHFSRIVKQVTEKTAKQFIEEAIVLEAKVLLQNNHLTILYIVEELNFSNSSAFSAFFKRHTSLSPSEYRLRLNSN